MNKCDYCNIDVRDKREQQRGILNVIKIVCNFLSMITSCWCTVQKNHFLCMSSHFIHTKYEVFFFS